MLDAGKHYRPGIVKQLLGDWMFNKEMDIEEEAEKAVATRWEHRELKPWQTRVMNKLPKLTSRQFLVVTGKPACGKTDFAKYLRTKLGWHDTIIYNRLEDIKEVANNMKMSPTCKNVIVNLPMAYNVLTNNQVATIECIMDGIFSTCKYEGFF
jgi:hypothetical protein